MLLCWKGSCKKLARINWMMFVYWEFVQPVGHENPLDGLEAFDDVYSWWVCSRILSPSSPTDSTSSIYTSSPSSFIHLAIFFHSFPVHSPALSSLSRVLSPLYLAFKPPFFILIQSINISAQFFNNQSNDSIHRIKVTGKWVREWIRKRIRGRENESQSEMWEQKLTNLVWNKEHKPSV